MVSLERSNKRKIMSKEMIFRKPTKIIFQATLASLLICPPAASFAAISPEAHNQAIQLMEQGDVNEAYAMLRKLDKTTAQDWFLFGLSAKNAGDWLATKHAMQKVIHLDPNNAQRAKLELAQAQHALENPDEARRLLNDVRAENPPDNVRQNIDKFLSIIGDKNCHTNGNQRWCAKATASVIYDSNVNNATTADTVTMFGLPFTLSEDAKAQSDFAYRLGVSYDHITTISDNMAWQTGLTANWTDYFTKNRYDVIQLLASTGPVFLVSPETIVSVPIVAQATIYTDLGDLYSSSIGVAPQIRHQLNDTVALNLNGNINWKHFNGDDTRDTVSYSLAPSFDFRACGQGTLRVGGGIGREDSGVDIYSNNNWNLNASLYCAVGENMALSVYGGYGQSDYDAKEVAYSQIRQDEATNIGASLQYAHAPSGLDFILGVNYTHNDSNLEIYEYDKFQTTISIREHF